MEFDPKFYPAPIIYSLFFVIKRGMTAQFILFFFFLSKSPIYSYLNMIFVPCIKMEKFSRCLILIVFLVPKKKFALSINPFSTQICLIYA